MFNRVILIGNLTRDIELRYLPSGAAIAKSAIATSFKSKTSAGEQREEVCFLDFNVFGKSAEIINQYVRKGSKVMLEGRLIFEQWTAQDGSNRTRHSLRVENFKFLDSKGDSSANHQNYDRGSSHQNLHQSGQASGDPDQNYQNKEKPSMDADVPEYDIDEDEIPF